MGISTTEKKRVDARGRASHAVAAVSPSLGSMASPPPFLSCGRRTRTAGLGRMGPACCHCTIPRMAEECAGEQALWARSALFLSAPARHVCPHQRDTNDGRADGSRRPRSTASIRDAAPSLSAARRAYSRAVLGLRCHARAMPSMSRPRPRSCIVAHSRGDNGPRWFSSRPRPLPLPAPTCSAP